ncbi:MAG TPA: CBS domain-containing protein [Candidatus Thermoplasmatota archaeon]|nr:CBS domain-containing protein [Candidatus Thermoplasmatota archaeon]
MNEIKELIRSDYPTIDENESISKAISKMDTEDGIILLKDGKYSGVLNKRDISKAKISPNTKANTFLENVAKVSSKETLENTAGLMLESDSYILPVFGKKKKFLGVITAKDVLKKSIEDDFGDEPIKHYISQPVIDISAEEPVSKAINIFHDEDISRLPVYENNELSGILTIDHILSPFIHPEHRQGGSGQYNDTSKYGASMADKKEYLDLPIKGVMSRTFSLKLPEENVRSIVKTMVETDYQGIFIGKKNDLVGVVTKRDLLEPLATTIIQQPVVIQFSGKLDKINDFDKKWAREVIHSNFEKHLDFLDNAHIYVRLKRHSEQSKGKHIIFCNMRLSSPRGMFVARDEGWGYMDAINKSADAVERQIRKQKRW